MYAGLIVVVCVRACVYVCVRACVCLCEWYCCCVVVVVFVFQVLKGSLIHKLGARRRIQELWDQSGDATEEVTSLSLQHSLISPFTSFVAVFPDRREVVVEGRPEPNRRSGSGDAYSGAGCTPRSPLSAWGVSSPFACRTKLVA